VVFAGQESLGWSVYESQAGPVTATVEASSQIRLDDGSVGKGFILRAGGSTVNVAITPGGPVPFGELVFRLDRNITARDGVHTFADIRQPDGTLVPVSITLRRKDQAQTPPTQASSFGPVIERVVPEAIDFDTGKLASLPEAVTKKENIAEAVLSATAWMEREGMDAFVDTRTHFFGVGMRAIAQDKSQWENLAAAQIVALLDASITQPSAYVPLEPLDGSATYAIQTREGGKGILQILGSTDGRRAASLQVGAGRRGARR
jgi:hypothetical protein